MKSYWHWGFSAFAALYFGVAGFSLATDMASGRKIFLVAVSLLFGLLACHDAHRAARK